MSRDGLKNPWLVRTATDAQPRLRLYCFPFAGGGASLFRRWPALLPPTVEVCAVQPPGREERLRETPYRDVASLLAAFMAAIGEEMTGPFVLFGHSMGALIGFELARLLKREGRRGPEALIVSGRIAPQLPLRRPRLHDLPEAEFRDQLRRLRGTPQTVLDHDELMQLFSPLLRADFALSDTYAYYDAPPLDLPIVALGGEDDPWVRRDELEAWRVQTTRAFEWHQFPGNHFFLQSAEAQVLRVVGRVVSRVEAAR